MADIVLGVSGSVAAYRACDLARELMRAGFGVRVCLTDAAERFVSRGLFEALTGRPCLQDTFEEPDAGRMAHIDWARAASVLVVAPATASTLARLAHGVGDDMLTTVALAYRGPVVVAPAMNPAMYINDATQANLATLRSRGVVVVEPVEGDVACGENGQGKLAAIGQIVQAVLEAAQRSQKLAGKTVLVTAGPTQEPVDDVRMLTNRSSGKMGYAVAHAARDMGARVVLVSGPTSLPSPLEVETVRVQTAEDMLAACLAHPADLVIAAAAVADYRPAERVRGKMRRVDAGLELQLVPNPDIVAALSAAWPAATVVAFAAEPDDGLAVAREKMVRKGVAAIAVNDVSRADIGFDSDENELTLLTADGQERRSGRLSKAGCARWLLEQVT
ncbi:MAG: bifunctional phosphopantothenoylcysteine decarboxylase/phosphopantothenate--cysteine ligase CoaBC [Armatimonadetes bacterium]|nr:bifunctional phosphopantothenoylcysteine decarboxylase/phosphopantothenate--cysteine ligase CoaBC [Armatimonadota bacterium]